MNTENYARIKWGSEHKLQSGEGRRNPFFFLSLKQILIGRNKTWRASESHLDQRSRIMFHLCRNAVSILLARRFRPLGRCVHSFEVSHSFGWVKKVFMVVEKLQTRGQLRIFWPFSRLLLILSRATSKTLETKRGWQAWLD